MPVGSSASTTGGLPAIARAIATRCRSPPDSWVGRAPARCPRPTRSSAAAARRRRPARGTPAYSSPSATLASTVWCSARKNCWNTKPIRAARSADTCRSVIRATSSPVTRTVPLLGRSRVPIRCSSVLLPDPDGPTTATSSPAATATLTSSSARTGGDPGYSFVTRSSSRTVFFSPPDSLALMWPAPRLAGRASAPRSPARGRSCHRRSRPSPAPAAGCYRRRSPRPRIRPKTGPPAPPPAPPARC